MNLLRLFQNQENNKRLKQFIIPVEFNNIYRYAQFMTISFRNKIFLGFLIFSILIGIGILIGCGIVLLKIDFNDYIPKIRWIPFLNSIFFTPYSFLATIGSIIIFGLYTPIAMIYLFYQFEKTQAIEIVFFTGFLVASQFDGLRIIIPLFNLEHTYPSLLLLLCKIIFFGRTFTILCFFFTVIFSASGLFQQAGKNIYFLIAISILLTNIIPMNTTHTTSTFMITYGFSSTYSIIKFILFSISILAFLITGKYRKISEYTKIAFSGIFLFSGYEILLSCDNWIFLVFGTLFLLFGTKTFISNIHQYYLWQ